MGIFERSAGFDADVEKATSETNTNENWTLILEVCDKVSLNSRNSKECLKAIMRRMAHNDPHVVMQAITLLDACVSNCGKAFHLEVASREFQTEFIRLLGKVQRKVQSKMCQVLKSWAEGEFKNDPELNLIPSLYAKLRQGNYDFTNFNDKPAKSSSQVTVSKDPNVVTSQQEEDDLAKAIELSLKEVKNSPKQGSSSASGGTYVTYSSLYPSVSGSGTAAATTALAEPRKVRALYDFEAAEENELTFVAGEIIHVTDDSDPNWWKGYNEHGDGLFPSNFVTADLSVDPERLEINQQHKVKKSNQFEEDSKELQQKTEAAAAAAATQRIEIDEQKIDRLIHLLNEANPEDPSQDTEEMLRLEQEVHQMGPLIDAELERVDRKHAQLSQLSSDLVDAINLYHSLMRDDRNALGSPYHMPGVMPGMPGFPSAHTGSIMYGGNPVFPGGFGAHSLPGALNSLPYSPPTSDFRPTQHAMPAIPIQYQNGHVSTPQAPHQPHSLQGLPPHMNVQIMTPQQQQHQHQTTQQANIYGPQQHMAASNNLNASSSDAQQQQQSLPSQQHQQFNMLPPQQQPQQQNQQQHYMPQQGPIVTAATVPVPSTNHMAPNPQLAHLSTQQQPQHQPHNQFISTQHQNYINNLANQQPSVNPHLYNSSVGDQQQQQQQQQQPQPSYMTAPPPPTGSLDQFGQLQQQMANMSMAGPQQAYQTNLPQNIPIYQQQR